MKKLLLITFTVLIYSCSEEKYEHIGQEIVEGKVSAVKEGKTASYGSGAILPKIWVQSPTATKEVEIPFDFEGRWKVGDTCLLIIEKYKEIENKK